MTIASKFTLFIFASLLIGCAGVKVTENNDSTKTAISNEGTSLNGGWNTASASATNKAREICNASGQIAVFLNESREGAVGWTRLSSAVTFKCVENVYKLVDEAYQRYKTRVNQNTDLEPIAKKIELTRQTESPVPFEISSNNNYPTPDEAKVIAKWASIRDEYLKEEQSIFTANQPTGNSLQQANETKLRSFRFEINARSSELIVALHQGKLTYGEFAQKRYEISNQLLSASRTFYSALLEKDRDIQIKQQSVAEQQAANNLAAWGAYMQSVNSRPVQIASPVQQIQITNPSSVRLQTNCTSQRIGGMVSTNCN